MKTFMSVLIFYSKQTQPETNYVVLRTRLQGELKINRNFRVNQQWGVNKNGLVNRHPKDSNSVAPTEKQSSKIININKNIL